MPLTIADGATLHNGVVMPWLGLGVFQSPPDGTTERAVRDALAVGYRHVDTAALYGNEADVGRAVRSSDVARSEVFVTSKVWNTSQGVEPTLAAFDVSMSELGLEYLDLYLLHWPFGAGFVDSWRALETLYRQERVRAIGVSNFLEHHLVELLAAADVPPMVNQVEHHPRLQQPELKAFCIANGIQLESWRPIMKGEVLQIPELRRIGDAYSKNPVQVVLRWMIQRGVVTIPKSVTPERIAANADIFDFELEAAELDTIDALDEGRRLGGHPDQFLG